MNLVPQCLQNPKDAGMYRDNMLRLLTIGLTLVLVAITTLSGHKVFADTGPGMGNNMPSSGDSGSQSQSNSPSTTSSDNGMSMLPKGTFLREGIFEGGHLNHWNPYHHGTDPFEREGYLGKESWGGPYWEWSLLALWGSPWPWTV